MFYVIKKTFVGHVFWATSEHDLLGFIRIFLFVENALHQQPHFTLVNSEEPTRNVEYY